MRLYRVHLNSRCKEARRDLADPYQMHATLCRAFLPSEAPCPAGTLLWRLEPETDADGRARVLIQSRETPDWSRIAVQGWLAREEPGKVLAFGAVQAGQSFRFRLRANPCKTVQGKRQGLLHPDAQREWLARKGELHGFTLPPFLPEDYFEEMPNPRGALQYDVRISHQKMIIGRQHGGNTIRIYSALFEGRLSVTDPEKFEAALTSGIGHGKSMGLGLVSIAAPQWRCQAGQHA